MKAPLRALLTERIDYAGLFPPAALSMRDAVVNYATYRGGPDTWALARFVVSVARLDEFEAAAASRFDGAPWRLAVLAQASDIASIEAFNARLAGRAVVDTVEARASDENEIAALASLASSAVVYVEIPVRDDPAPLLASLHGHGMRAKLRTGGVTRDAFPSAPHVARFLASCARRGVVFKATAGLHHPLRGDYALTYDVDAARGTMFGYLNVFLAASFARQGMAEPTLVQLLETRRADAFGVTHEAVTWRNHTLTTAMIAADRADLAVSFGSCSFREPLDDLLALPLP